MIENPRTGTTSRVIPALLLAEAISWRQLAPVLAYAVCICHPLLLGPPGCAATHFEYGWADQKNLQMTLVKLHACQYPKVKPFPDIGQTSGVEQSA
jgi:hypothetical protein